MTVLQWVQSPRGEGIRRAHKIASKTFDRIWNSEWPAVHTKSGMHQAKERAEKKHAATDSLGRMRH